MQRADVIILGGGLVGLTLAVALDAHGLTSIVVDPADPATLHAPTFDGRASAVASASWRMLEAIGIAPRLAGEGCAIRRIAVRDGLTPSALVFDPAPDDAPLGTMFENRTLRRVLHEAASAAAGVTLLAPATPAATTRDAAGATVTLADGRMFGAALLVGAEGRRSPTREAAGIGVAQWRYRHRAIITTIGHALPHDGIAHEIFYPAGPFALLPLRDDADGPRAALVWTVAEADADATLALPPRAFAAEVGKRMGAMLGAVRADGRRASYPLGFHHAARITGERLALVGDAAHGIHPIAGQGLNLGLRDVAALAQVLAEGVRLGLDAGDAQGLARYARWRAVDTLAVAAATDTLTRLFGVPGRTARAVRRLGLGAVSHIAPLRARFMAEARGEAGTLPALLTGMLA